jgi:L-arabinokinase
LPPWVSLRHDQALIVAYVSGHGYGHATRTGEVLRTLLQLAPGTPLTLVSAAPEWLFRQAIGAPFAYRALECDVGLVQRGALVIDEAATVKAWRAFATGWDTLVDGEARWLRSTGARVVLGDVPPLAFAVAAVAEAPSLALANFSWDWVYARFAAREPVLGQAAAHCAQAYANCGLLLRLPFAGDLSAFPRVEDVPLVARRPRVGRQEARRRLGLPVDVPIVLLSFGGIGLPGFDLAVLEGLDDLHFVTVGGESRSRRNLATLAPASLDTAGLGYEDLVGAADVVVTKPGYGIVSDAIGAGTRLVYTDRGDFPEYPILVREMARYLPIAYVSNADLLAGRLGDPIRSVLDAPTPPPPSLDGAARVAGRILEFAGAD